MNSGRALKVIKMPVDRSENNRGKQGLRRGLRERGFTEKNI